MTRKRVVWIVSMYTQSPKYDSHLRHRKFAEYLNSKDYEVIIITSSVLHNINIDLIEGNEKYKFCDYDGLSYVHIKTNHYGQSNLKRIWGIFLFSYRLYRFKGKLKKPDIVIHNLHAPFDALVYLTAKKLKAKYITEVWDLWPESFVASGLVSRNNILIKLAYRVESWLYEKAERNIFTMEGGWDYITRKKWDIFNGGKIDQNKYVYLNNGVDVHEFNYNRLHYKIEDKDLIDDKFKVIYLGAIRLMNNLQLLIDAAKFLKDRNDIVFLIYGDGDEREKLIQYCQINEITNVKFKEKWIEIKYVPYVLSCSSLNVLNYADTSEFEYGGSQGKLFQYLASGKPIIANQVIKYNPIDKYNAGVTCNFETAEEYAMAIKDIADLNVNEYDTLCRNALRVVQDFDYNILSSKLLRVLNSL